MTSSDLYKLLRQRYKDDGWVVLPQVRGGTGSSGSRFADAVAMSLWPSRGLELEGFEIKVSRNDWLRELKEPEKADEIYRHCDRWWIVAADESIVREGELPPTWGLMVVRGGRLINKTLAPKLSPQPLSKGFFAALLRVVSKEYIPAEVVRERQDDAFRRGEEAGRVPTQYLAEKYQSLRESVDAFEAKSGVRINDYNGETMGEAVAFVAKVGVKSVANSMRSLNVQLRNVLDHLEQAAESIDPQGDNAGGRRRGVGEYNKVSDSPRFTGEVEDG